MLDLLFSEMFYVSIIVTLIVLVFSTKYVITALIPKQKNAVKSGTIVDKGDATSTDDTKTTGEENIDSFDSMPNIDPVEYCEHIQSEVKKAKLRFTERKFNQSLTPEQIQEEKAVQRQQLEAIFKMMEGQDKQFGVGSIEDIQSQMKLYA